MKHVPKLENQEGLLLNKNVLITGSGSGIGRAVAKAAAKQGANLILLSKDIKKLYSLQDEICNEGHSDPLVVELDFFKAKEKDYKTLAENLYEQYEHLDGLVHIAGILGYLSPIINTFMTFRLLSIFGSSFCVFLQITRVSFMVCCTSCQFIIFCRFASIKYVLWLFNT